jgi:hypothetical protein
MQRNLALIAGVNRSVAGLISIASPKRCLLAQRYEGPAEPPY